MIGYQRIPRITDPARAREAPQLAVLSALAHPDADVAQAAFAGLGVLSEDDQKLYWDVILNGLPAIVRHALEARMIKGYQYQSDFARKYHSQGHKEGQEKARENLRRAIVEAVSARLPGLRDELASRLRDQPEAVLGRIAVELGGAPDEGGVRAVLDRMLDRRA